MLSSIFSSSRSALSPQKTLDLANSYLETAHKTQDLEIALVLCDDAEASLSQMKRALKKAHNPQSLADQTLRDKIATAYFTRGQILENLSQHDRAQDSYRKAEKWGYTQLQSKLIDTSLPVDQASTVGGKVQIPAQIFPRNLPCPLTKYTLPSVDERITDAPQLAYCLNLLSATASDKELNPIEHAWSQSVIDNTDEQERLRTLATDLIKAFINDELKDAPTVAEIVYLADALEQVNFRKLLAEFVDSIGQSTLLDSNLLRGLAQLIRSAAPGYLEADDLVKILELLGARLQATHSQATHNLHQLTLTVSNVLDAMADSRVQNLNREQLHEPLSAYLKGLQSSSDPYLVYQAAYACQALQYVPNDETPWQAALRRTGRVLEGVSGLVSAVKGLNLYEFIQGLERIHEGVTGSTELIKAITDTYKGVISLNQSGQSFLECLQEGFSSTHKRAWYQALRGADTLLQNGQFADFKKLVCEVPCRHHPAFQWGLCERIGQLAADPLWDANTRQSALDFLGELYKNDAMWGQRANVKQWIIKILIQLADSSTNATAAKTLLKNLEKIGDVNKQALYRICLEEGPSSYPLNVALPVLASPSLLDRVQNKQDVETDLRKLKHRRLSERSEAVYISPQGKPSLQAPDTAIFDLMEKVQDFLHSDQKVFLLLGDSGAGKSTFNRALENSLWNVYEKKKGRIPLFITLPAINKPEHDLVAKQLRKEGFTEAQIKELKNYRKFVLICDSYDESQQTHNLYMSNRLNQPGEWRAQMIISCRSEYLGRDYQDRFQPTDRNHHVKSALFQEAVVAPLSVAQIQAYIKRYVQIKKPVWRSTDYQLALKHIPHLKDLVRNPFLLALSLEVLPRLVSRKQDLSTAKITRVTLYDQFVAQWLERGKKRLGEKDLSSKQKRAYEHLVEDGFTQNGIAFMKRLATEIYEQQAGNPVVEYSHFRDEGTWKEAFFGVENKNQLLREASSLSRSGNQYQFIHKSLLEYGVARAIFEPQNEVENADLTQHLSRRGSVSSFLSFESQNASDDTTLAIEQPLLDSPLARKNLVREPSILQFLAERAQQEPLFKRQLLAVIERSKKDQGVRRAAANAITILVKAGIQFNGADLKKIQIPGADLSEGVFDYAQLQGADLRKVNLRNIWLRQANLSDAQMADVQFGERPFLKENSKVNTCMYSPDGKACAVGLESGTISLYHTSNWEKIQTLVGHTDWVKNVLYSQNGQQIASCSDDKTVRLWDAKSGQLKYTLSGHTGRVESIAYSPNSQQIASGSEDTTVRLWNTQSGQLSHTLSGHTGYVWKAVYSPNGQQIASGSEDSTVRLWDPRSGQLRYTLSGHTKSVSSLAYSPDGQQIASGSQDSSVRLWDPQSGQLMHILNGHAFWVRSVIYSPDGQQIASSSSDKTVRLWDTHSGQIRHTLRGHTDFIKCLMYSPSGQQIASGSADKSVRLWDTHSGQLSHTLSGHIGYVWSIAYSPNGQQIVSGSLDATVRLWNAHSYGQLYNNLKGHIDQIKNMVSSPNGQQIASGSQDNTVRLWDAQFGQLRYTLSGHTHWIESVVYSPSGQQIASGSRDSTVRLWDAQSGQLSHTLSGHTKSVYSVVYSPNGEQIASGSDDHTVRLWNSHSGQLNHTLSDHTGSIRSVVYSPNGQQIASGSDDNTVRLWNAQSAQFSHTLSGHTDIVLGIVYSPDGQQIASSSSDKTVRLWDAHSGQLNHTLKEHTGYVRSIVYSPNGQQIASGSQDKTVRLWDAQSGQLSHTLSGHSGYVWSIAYSPNGQQIVSGSLDTTVRLWDVASGQCLSIIQDFQGAINSVIWKENSDGNYFATGSGDKSVRLWQVIEENDQYQIRLRWSSTHAALTVTDTFTQGVQGLSQENKQLLKQRGAMGEPSLQLRKPTHSYSTLAAVV